LMCPLADAAPPVRFERLGLDEGLSQQAVLAIGQDASGFIWLGTEDGLNRYDGFTFQSSGRDGVHMEGLSNAFVTDIQTDAAGALWIATDGGGILAREAHSGRFTGLPPAIAGDAGLDSARTLKFDARGRVWIGTRDAGVAIYDPQRQTIKRFRHDANDTSSLSADAIHSLLIVAGGAWIGTASGLDYLSDDPDSKPRRYALGSSSWRTGGAHAVRAMLEDRAGMLWIATDRGLIRLEPGGGKQTLFQSDAHAPDALPADEVQALLEDSAGRLWVGTSAGLAAYDATKQRFDIYKHDAADPTSLPDDRIVSLFEDRAGLLWVGTQLAGVAKWNPRSWSFGHRRERDAPAMVNHITSFTEDRLGTVWIGTFGAGLHTVDEASGAMRRWPDERDGAGSSGDDAIMALLTDRAGAVWVGTMNGGLRRIAPGRAHTDTYQHDPTNPHSLPADGVMSLLEDSAGRIWIGTYGGGLSRFTPATNDFQPAVAGVPESSPLSGGRVTALAEDAEGRIWAGTDGAGLHMLIPATGETRHWLHDAADADSLSADTIYALHLDASGVLWIGTHGGGVARVRATGESSPLKFSRYDETRGLPDNTVYGILSDDQGRLWLSTGRGLASLEPQTGAVRSFHRGHGLQGEEFNFGAAFRSGAGRLYFGGTNGYNVFTPQLLEFNTHPPAVALTGVSILNQPLQSVSPYERLEQLQLGYRDQVVTFDFAALDFAAPRENRYRYRLEGFDADWVDAGGRRSATYTRLAGGRYTFRVQAANAHSRWSDSGLALPLQVEAPPWKRSWAYAGYVAVVCLCICACWVAWRNKRAREQRYRLLLETKVRDRTREIAERNAELEVANRRLEEASLTDPLTGLANRRALMQALPSLAASCHGERRVPAQAGQIILMIIDLDYFKPINDRYGHEAGDAVLKQVAAILRDCVRSTDLAVRWGGDEFVVVYAAANLSEGGVLAERIRSRIAKHHFQLDHGNTARTSCSIGFVCYPFVSGAPHLLSHEQSLNVADTALLEAKAERNAWIGWGGMPTAHDITGLFKALDSNPALVAERGALQVVSSAYRPDDTVDDLIRHLRAR
ncbi:MAG: two-component regulator propeller domain-containing protein, partial [Pseudomonadota bacterium]|nr:two-component regulator propeller domain-containing protein [Pseudomonadota bacterium]